MNTPTKEIETRRAPQLVELSDFPMQAQLGANALGGQLGLLGSVKVRLNVVLGHVQTTLGEIMELKESTILKVDRPVDSPVDVLVDGNIVARGQLVVVDDNFGVRITEIASVAKP